MKLRTAIVSAALLMSASGVAMAQMGLPDWTKMPDGVYISAYGGANWAKSRDLSNPALGPILGAPTLEVDFDTGWVGTGAIGYQFWNGAAIELEGGYRSNKGDTISSPALGAALGGVCPNGVALAGNSCPIDGKLSQLSIMANFIYNIATGTQFVPQLGFGAGAVRGKVHDANLTGAPFPSVDDSDWAFGVQGIAGLAFYLTEQLSLGVRYTYLHTGAYKNLETLLAAAVPTTDSKLDSGGNHAVMAGLRWDFGLRPRIMPAVAPPPPAIIRNWTVYFDHDKSVITPEGDRVVQAAADHAKRGNVARLTVTGHADRSGTVQYNQALSQRRADTVTGRLVGLGIPRDAISIFARGETQPAVPTADGVREPQNRRVEIVLQ